MPRLEIIIRFSFVTSAVVVVVAVAVAFAVGG
jgi:hypothetical protein